MKKEKLKVSGTFLYFDRENGNGRIYPHELAGDILRNLQKDINEGNILGEWGYPDRFEVSLANVSHRVTEIHFNPEKNSIDGTIEILNGTPKGNKLLGILEENNKGFNDMFVVRPRGMGNVNENKEVENFTLYTFDIIPKENDAFKGFENGN